MISIETEVKNDFRGMVIDITESNSYWFEVWLGDKRLYFDTCTHGDGKEYFNAVFIDEEELLTNKEWNER